MKTFCSSCGTEITENNNRSFALTVEKVSRNFFEQLLCLLRALFSHFVQCKTVVHTQASAVNLPV